MKIILCIISLSLFTTISNQHQVELSDLTILEGNWNGSLMYINYSDNREVTLRSTLKIEIKNDKLIGKIGYTDEPSANGKLVVELKKQGTYINNEEIISKSTQDDGTVTIKTRYTGRDANKSATMYMTYVFDKSHLTMTKEVQFKNTTERFVRNRYTYTR